MSILRLSQVENDIMRVDTDSGIAPSADWRRKILGEAICPAAAYCPGIALIGWHVATGPDEPAKTTPGEDNSSEARQATAKVLALIMTPKEFIIPSAVEIVCANNHS